MAIESTRVAPIIDLSVDPIVSKMQVEDKGVHTDKEVQQTVKNGKRWTFLTNIFSKIGKLAKNIFDKYGFIVALGAGMAVLNIGLAACLRLVKCSVMKGLIKITIPSSPFLKLMPPIGITTI